jgi:hypothetical protein
LRIRDVARAVDGGADVSFWPYPNADHYKVYRSPDPRTAGSFADVTGEDADASDTTFHDTAAGDVYWLVSGVGPGGEGPVVGP